MAAIKRHPLADDTQVRAVIQLTKDAEGWGSFYGDGSGLRLRIGKRHIAWYYYAQVMMRGERKATQKFLGHWPKVNTAKARKEADKLAGHTAAGRLEPGRKNAAKFEEAFHSYVLHLRQQSAEKGKTPLWANIV